MNPVANPTAQAVDNVLIYIFGFSLLLLLGITVSTIYLVVKYRRSKYPEPTSDCHGNMWLEAVWTILPTLIVLSMFWYGWINYTGLREVPEGALEVTATARMWSWQFEYPDGRRTDKLYVPVNKPIKVHLKSTDVLHSFFAPAFRIKRDAVPGIDTYLWFEATEPGSYDIFCAEYCGVGHADMLTSIVALNDADFVAWTKSAEPDGEPKGLTILNEFGCLGCHSTDGSESIAPTFKGLGQRQSIIIRDGQEMTINVDSDYLRRALLKPNDDLVKGFSAIMPSAESLSDSEIEELIQYLLKQ